ncbi:MAG: radical SAM protein, partial [Candidatus Methylomirabilis sp.]|nr:radical SAM protein [Deltaproteobacteria bacterium]
IYATMWPERLLAHPAVETVLQGEIDEALPDWLERRAAGEDPAGTPGAWTKRGGETLRAPERPLIQDLSKLPPPDRAIYYGYRYLRDFPVKRFSTGRGCPDCCRFCYNHNLQAVYGREGFARRKPVPRVIEEIRWMRENAAMRRIYFLDDHFAADPAWLRAFAEAYAREFRVPFTAQTTVDALTDEAVELLARAGCDGVLVGVETGDEALRERILGKRFSNDEVVRRARKARAAGMRFLANYMMLIPGESADSMRMTARFNRRVGTGSFRTQAAFPLPGTPMAEAKVRLGEMTAEQVERLLAFDAPPVMPIARLAAHLPKAERLRRLRGLYLFPSLQAFPRLERFWPLLLRLPLTPLYAAAFYAFRLETERRLFGVPLLAGLRFFLRAGHPARKTKNLSQYVP